MSDLFQLTDAHMTRLEPFFPISHGNPRADDRRVLSGTTFINRTGLRWRHALSAAKWRAWAWTPCACTAAMVFWIRALVGLSVFTARSSWLPRGHGFISGGRNSAERIGFSRHQPAHPCPGTPAAVGAGAGRGAAPGEHPVDRLHQSQRRRIDPDRRAGEGRPAQLHQPALLADAEPGMVAADQRFLPARAHRLSTACCACACRPVALSP